MLNSLFTLMGTFVGAGFASGKEIFNFFSTFGIASFLEIIIFSFLFLVTIYKTLNLKMNLHLTSYEQLLLYLDKKYKYFHSKIFIFFVNTFLLISFYIMVCALCTLFYDKWNIAKYISVSFVILICYIIFSKNNIKFIYALNLILMPILILFILILGIKTIHFNILISHDDSFILISIFKCLLYFSYNSLLIIPILFKIDIKQEHIFKISLYFSCLIFILMNILNLILLANCHFISEQELPVLYISKINGSIYSFLYFFIFLSAILTTMISSGFAFCNNIHQNKNLIIIVFLLCSFVFSAFSFSSLINFFYSALGLIGLLQIILILSDKY